LASHSEEQQKREAAYAAVDRFVEDGMCIGLGTGTTARWSVERVGARVAQGERIAAVATSLETEHLCRTLDIPLLSLMEREIAVAIDGADEIGPGLALIKGGGGALFREKAVALAARRFVVVATERKVVPCLGRFPLPLEVVPFSADYVAFRVVRLGAHRVERRGGTSPFMTDNGNWILDCAFEGIDDPAALDEGLRSIHGVVGTGLFIDIAGEAVVAGPDGVRSIARVHP
jgi:ribose 5-phosphate isomerase A